MPTSNPTKRVLLPCQGLLTAFFAASLIFTLSLAIYQFKNKPLIETDLQALFPQEQSDPIVAKALDILSDKYSRNLLLLISAEDWDDALRIADLTDSVLASESSLLASQLAAETTKQNALVELIKHYQFQLLSKEHQRLLTKDNSGAIISEAYQSIYSPGGWGGVIPLNDDPLNMLDSVLSEYGNPNTDFETANGHLFIPKPNNTQALYFFQALEIQSDPFNLDVQQQVDAALTRLEQTLKTEFPKVEILRSGVILHAQEAASQTKKDVTYVAIGSSIGVTLLFLWVFRSLIPMALAMTAIVFGSAFAFTFCHWVFGKIHIITLVFGASLIGVSVDYSLHYFTHLKSELVTSSNSVAKTLFSGLLLGMLTSVIAYGCLFNAPLPGLQQVAIFSMSGLFGAWLFVVGVFPFIQTEKKYANNSIVLKLANTPQKLWQMLNKKISIALFSAIAIIGVLICFTMLSTQNSIASLHKPLPHLIENDRRVQGLLNVDASNQFFLLKANTAQALLEKEEVFKETLDELVSLKAIVSYDAVTNWLPSISKQKSNYALLDEHIYGDSGAAFEFMTAIGLSRETIAQRRIAFQKKQDEFLYAFDWLAAAPSYIANLWLGEFIDDNDGAQKLATIIRLQGIQNLTALTAAANPESDIVFVDKVNDLSNQIGNLRDKAAYLLIAAFFAAALLFIASYRQIQAGTMVLAPILSSITSLALLAIIGESISLFHVFGLFLVLGLGMDYSVFLDKSKSYSGNLRQSTSLAILLSAITSCLSFGLLGFSSTPFIQDFGITLLLGSLFNLVFASGIQGIKDQLRAGQRINHS